MWFKSNLQLWMIQCDWHCQSCSYGCSSVNDSVNPAVMDAPVSVTLSTLQQWMLKAQWYWSIQFWQSQLSKPQEFDMMDVDTMKYCMCDIYDSYREFTPAHTN